MAHKNPHEAARAKAAKEKKLLIGLAPLLLVAGFFAYHTMTKLHSSSAPTAAGAAATTPATTVSTGTPISATTPVTAPPLTTLPPSSGKLNRLPNFAPKDPFHDQGPRASSTAAANTNSKGSATKQTSKKAAVPPPTSAVIAVNGRLVSVAMGTIFPLTKNPATNGIFKLVGLTAKTAKVAVVGGSYASGAHALTLSVNSVVKLVNTADGKRYTLILYPQGTLVPSATITPATPPPTTTTTNTTTTTTTTTGP